VVDTAGAILLNDPANYGIYVTDILRNPGGKYAITAFGDYGAPQGGSAVFCIIDSSASSVPASTKFKITASDVEPVQLLMDHGNYLMAANAMNLSSGANEGILFKLDSAGGLIWAKKFTPSGMPESKINAAMIASDGSYLVTGSVGSYPNYAVYVVKMDSSGSVCQSVNVTTSKSAPAKSTVTPHSVNAGTISIYSTTSPPENPLTLTSTVFCTSINEIKNAEKSEAFLYPNPATDVLFIRNFSAEKSEVSIYSSDGRLVIKQNMENRSEVNVRSLSPGIYSVSLKDNSGKVISKMKFLKD
jgi:hypothetical protein